MGRQPDVPAGCPALQGEDLMPGAKCTSGIVDQDGDNEIRRESWRPRFRRTVIYTSVDPTFCPAMIVQIAGAVALRTTHRREDGLLRSARSEEHTPRPGSSPKMGAPEPRSGYRQRPQAESAGSHPACPHPGARRSANPDEIGQRWNHCSRPNGKIVKSSFGSDGTRELSPT